MPKISNRIVVSGRIPEWGVSPKVSTAVPLVASAAEVKSTKRASEAIYILLRSRLKNLRKKKSAKDKDIAELRSIVAKAKQGQPVTISFTINRSRTESLPGAVTVRRASSAARKRR